MKVSAINVPRTALGEGPVWDEIEQALYYVDASNFRIHRYDPLTGHQRHWQFESRTSALALREGGGFVVVLDDGVFLVDAEGGERRLLADPEGSRDTRSDYNDAKVDPQGRFLVNSANLPVEGVPAKGSLYSIGEVGEWSRLDDEIYIGNGPCWSPDGTTLYHADSLRHEIYAFDYDLETGAATNKRVFANTERLGGIPDGATVDEEGALWTAICESGTVVRFSPAGELLETIDIPARLVSSVIFGGLNLDTLYVTSIDPPTLGMPEDPNGGISFAITGLGVRGLPSRRFPG
ncbi:SMP-30/gluconolactonase/LRE family protein [Salinibacterium sp. ZJ454]|uniref:SMP-30/gluconolactonase/LRE family protein n=1 Tax=Salinibacterium sp. ZJ454 TaxID=2708339 RepID=UPI001420763B|nr:SMP-30/gluconolactonase/LRE family protein [Salinibacterium sp. ZJ454]